MTHLDYIIFGVYLAGVLAMGIYHYLRNESAEDYYLGGRRMGAGHIGLSIVATDVGGGFSIGLGGLGFVMGLAGSWLLFTGLVGAWLAAVLVIPRVKALDDKVGLMTYPDLLRHRFGEGVALLAAVISGLGYLGFTAGQILAGAAPEQAVRYQIVVMFMIAGATSSGALLAGVLAFRRLVTPDHQLAHHRLRKI